MQIFQKQDGKKKWSVSSSSFISKNNYTSIHPPTPLPPPPPLNTSTQQQAVFYSCRFVYTHSNAALSCRPNIYRLELNTKLLHSFNTGFLCHPPIFGFSY